MANAQDFKCGICGHKLGDFEACNFDHVIPRSKGGKNHGNILFCHITCNANKGDEPATDFEIQMLNQVNSRLNFIDKLYIVGELEKNLVNAFKTRGKPFVYKLYGDKVADHIERIAA